MSSGNSHITKLGSALDPYSPNQNADAAVALLLRASSDDLQILVVKRIESLSDPWSGQIALPGGKRSAEDEDLKATVFRETLEETNINLNGGCSLLGVMKIESTVLKPRLAVLPFVFLSERHQAIKLSITELEWFAWTSIEQLRLHRRTVEFPFGKFPALAFADNIIWGLTYRILERLFGILQ